MLQPIRIVLLGAAAVFLATAQTDPPGRVGRLNYSNGQVSFRPGDVEDWVPAEVNRPLTSGDHLWTDDGARVELHIGTAALRLSSRTAFQFLNLDDNAVQIRLTEGSLNVHLRTLSERETFEVDTPNTSVALLRTGDYRIDVNPDNFVTAVTVRGGEGEVTGTGQAFPVRAGEQARISGSDSLSYDTAGAPPIDEWDSFCSARDRREEQSQSARYVPREMVGYQDLDDYGAWRNVPEYGPIWAPRTVEVGWSPYHYGHWAWVEPWGWTWVDDAPWGFAPFHYGRWVYVGYWAWVPGPVAVRPVYAPALVAWVGGPRFSMAVGFGGGVAGVAWFPLGPREVYVPAYGASAVYINRVNVTNTTIVNNINVTNINTTNIRYVNREAPGAVTAVPQNAFASARPVQGAAVPVRAEALQSAQVMNTAQVAPSRASVTGAYAGARVAQPPASAQNRSVVTRTAPPPAPVPFTQRQQALAANPGRPLDSGQMQQLRVSQPQPARSFVRPAQPPSNANAGGGGTGGSFAPRPGGQTAPPAGQTRPPAGPAGGANTWSREGNQPARVTQAPPQNQQTNVPQNRVPQNQAPRSQPANVAPSRLSPNNAPPRVERPPQVERQAPREQRKEERKEDRKEKQF
jgi:FecR protein